MKSTYRALPLVAWIIGTPVCPVWAQTAPADSANPRGVWSAVVENDALSGTDLEYTSGARLSFFGETREGSFHNRMVKGLLGDGGDQSQDEIWGLALGQSLFTPNDITLAEPVPGERPYAAWLYLEYTLAASRGGTIDEVNLQIGVVGESALGEEAQTFIHSIYEAPKPQGWPNQIENEPGVILTMNRKFPSRRLMHGGGLECDIIPDIGVSVGNVLTQAQAGATIRVGTGLTGDVGPPRIRPAIAGSGYFRRTAAPAIYAFAGVQGRAVAHNMFLEGSLFRDDPITVDREPLVYDLEAGAVVTLGRARMSYTYVSRSEEYETQEARQDFAALSLSVRF